MNRLHRELAPISESVWGAIDLEAKTRLTTNLAARKFVDWNGPHGWPYSATSLGRINRISAPAEGIDAAQRAVIPLVELRAQFSVNRVEVNDAERGASDLDFAELDEAARRIAIGENVTVFHGFEAAGIRGISQCSSYDPIVLEQDIERYPNGVARAIDILKRSGIAGPYGLAIEPNIYTSIIETTEHGGYLLLDHLRQIIEGPLIGAPGVQGGVVLSLRGGDFIFDSGEDLSIGYIDHDVDVIRLYIEESFTFKVTEPDAAIVLRTSRDT